MTIDIVTQHGTIHEVKAIVLFHCPYCGRPVTTARRLSYPEQIAGCFLPVYRCGCGKHMGAPIVGEVKE